MFGKGSTACALPRMRSRLGFQRRGVLAPTEFFLNSFYLPAISRLTPTATRHPNYIHGLIVNRLSPS
jgi:hypothetical protein